MELDARFLEELIRNMPSEEDQLKMDEEKVHQKFEELIYKDSHVRAMWHMYMNYPITEEHAYQKLIIALVQNNDKLTEMLEHYMMTSVNPIPMMK